jgi:hypothetical protein
MDLLCLYLNLFTKNSIDIQDIQQFPNEDSCEVYVHYRLTVKTNRPQLELIVVVIIVASDKKFDVAL